jgi:hypothetical protein
MGGAKVIAIARSSAVVLKFWGERSFDVAVVANATSDTFASE